jgi:FlaA1/EpsC-like NDP-sugar epimerase
MKNFYSGKNIFITGAAGTIGRELIKELAEFNPKKIIAIDNNETEVFFLAEKYKSNPAVHCFICDIRDKNKLKFLMKDCDMVFHGAALKHVILGEYNPFDIVQTNLMGLQNIIEISIESGVKKVLFMSSDKAVNPTNAMGASKLMGEKLIAASNNLQDFDGPIFCSTRFGNVLGSRGSVVPVFLNQLREGRDLTVTDESMTRFVMKKGDAVKLILKSLMISKGGESFILKMDSVKIIDLAYAMLEDISGIFGNVKSGIKFIGAKPGEKLFEELLSEEETQRTIELEDLFVVLPAFKSIYFNRDYKYDGVVAEKINTRVTSNMVELLSKRQIKDKYVKYIKENINEFLS